jgi:hypothetical protein
MFTSWWDGEDDEEEEGDEEEEEVSSSMPTRSRFLEEMESEEGDCDWYSRFSRLDKVDRSRYSSLLSATKASCLATWWTI